MVKRAHEPLIKPLTLLINQTLFTGTFPNDLKISRLRPLFKQGSSLFSNYRPISLLASLAKIYEYVVFEQLLLYMEDNGLFYNDQFGFRAGHSTELASVRFVDTLVQQISSNLKWNKHINHISIKVSKVIGIMFRLKYIVPVMCY